MDLEEEILARINAAKALDKTINVSDFQLKVGDNGSVLINLKTSRAQLIYDDDSKLHDIEDLLPASGGHEYLTAKVIHAGRTAQSSKDSDGSHASVDLKVSAGHRTNK